jgi:copper chaperone CopZ
MLMKKTFILIGVVVFILTSCKSNNTQTSVSEGAKTTDLIVNPDALIQMDVLVEGMTCTGCENTINTGVSEIAGVIEVKSSFQDGKTFVKYDSTLTNINKISEVISEKGYSVKGYAVHNKEENAPATKE